MTKNEILKKHGLTEQEFYAKYPTQESYMQEFGEGGTIHIKPENKGKFTAYKQRTGKTTEEALHSPNAHVRQMANFARNAAKWKHEKGGVVDNIQLGLDAAQFIPGIGEAAYLASLPFTTYDVAKNLYNTNYKQAGMDALGYIPGLKAFKYGVKGNKILDTTSKLAKQYKKVNNVVNGVNLTNDARKKADGGMMKSSRITPEITRLDNGGQMNYYNNQINKENALATGLLQTGLGLAGTAIGGPAGGMVGSSLGSAVGGLFEQGGPLTKYNGLKHSEGGIALGNTGNEVEDKETRIGDFIFSEKLKANKNTSFADMSKKIEKQTVGRRDNDKISKTTFDRKIGALAEKQEASKAVNGMSNTTNKFEGGTNNLSGKNPYSNPYRDNSYLQPYTYNSKPSFMNIPSSINTPVEQPNNSRFNFEPIEPKNPILIMDKALVNPNFTPKPLNRIMPNSIQNPGLGKMPNYSPLNPDGSLSVKRPFKNMPGNKLYYNFNNKEYNPESKYIEPITKNPATKDKKQMDLSWLNPALQMGLSSLGNYKPLTVKNYQMKPDLLDSTQAKKENRDAFSGLNSDLATSGLTGGQYLASRMGSAAQQAGENAKIDNVYRTANVGIKNQFKQMNTATDKEVQELNAREIDASKTAKQFRNQNIASALGQARQDKISELKVLNPDYEWTTDRFGRKINQRRIPGTQTETPNYASQNPFNNSTNTTTNTTTTTVKETPASETKKSTSPANPPTVTASTTTTTTGATKKKPKNNKTKGR